MRNQVLFLLIICFISNNLFGHENENKKRNLIKGSIATSGILNGMISVDYERNLLFKDFVKLNIECSYGKYYQIHTSDAFQSYPAFNSLTSCINYLAGKKSHFLEISTGVRYSIIKDDYYNDIKPLYPLVNIGYRFHNYYRTGLIFRTFLGTTGLGLSVGIAF